MQREGALPREAIVADIGGTIGANAWCSRTKHRECEAVEDKKHDPKSHSSLLAVEDLEFLQSDEMRPLRLALEFSKVVDLALKMRGICIFGSRVGFGRRPFCSSPGSRAEPFFLR